MGEGKFPIPNIVTEENKYEWDDSMIINDKTTILTDGRPLRSQLWLDRGYTFMSYFFPVKDIEGYSKDELTWYLKKNGIKLDEKQFINIEICRIKDLDENDCWDYTIMVGRPNE